LLIEEFEGKTVEEKKIDSRKERVAQLKALNARYDLVLPTLAQIGDQSNLSALSLLLRGELLKQKLEANSGVILFVKAVGGGENRTSQNLWRSGRLE